MLSSANQNNDKFHESYVISDMGEDVKVKYEAAMVLGAVGDALGFKNGHWEFCKSGKHILEELKGKYKCVDNIKVCKPDWIVSDDTVMHLATADALIECDRVKDKQQVYRSLQKAYVKSMDDMKNRFPGEVCINACNLLKHYGYENIPFNDRGGGCGAAMRAMCIGLRYPSALDQSTLIEVSIEAGRMTHHHPTGYLGSMATALFTSYAIQGKPIVEWGTGLREALGKAQTYVKSKPHTFPKLNLDSWWFFRSRWDEYLQARNLTDGKCEPFFPADFIDITRRDKFYKYLSYSEWAGSSGHDAPMIAYDAILACNGDWRKLCNWAMFHGGDSDTTGSIAGCLFGALHGFSGVNENNYKCVEYHSRLSKCAYKLYDIVLGT